MKKAFLVAAGISVLGAMSAEGQALASSPCPNGSTNTAQRFAQDACQQAYDVYQFMAPQLASAIAGGNATLGQGSTLGGLGHFSIGVRLNAVQGAYPDVKSFQTNVDNTGATRRTLPTKDSFIPFPTADAAIGIFGGIPLGVTNVGAVDALVSATFVPTYSTTDFSITPAQSLQLGYGARLGILQESIVVPGIAVTYLKRDLPKTKLIGTSGNSSLTISDLEVKTTSWRIVASKSLVVLGFVVGAGQDKLENSAAIAATVSGTPVGSSTNSVPTPPTQSMTRTNYFADVSLNLPLFKIVAEAGQVSGTSASTNTFNSFNAGLADRSLIYYSLGLRLGF